MKFGALSWSGFCLCSSALPFLVALCFCCHHLYEYSFSHMLLLSLHTPMCPMRQRRRSTQRAGSCCLAGLETDTAPIAPLILLEPCCKALFTFLQGGHHITKKCMHSHAHCICIHASAHVFASRLMLSRTCFMHKLPLPFAYTNAGAGVRKVLGV